jgi:hypothetical protein
MKNLLLVSSLLLKLASIRSKNFEVRTFLSLNDPIEVFNYADFNLEPIDEFGTSRGVFILNSKYVLKIALPENLKAGIAQNQKEVEYSAKFPDITAKITSYHPSFYWIKTELVRPVLNQEELLSVLNLSSPKDIGCLFSKFPDKNHKLLKTPNEIAMKVSSLVREGVLHYDVAKSDSWGITTDGKPVLLDYGMTKNIWDEFYRK